MKKLLLLLVIPLLMGASIPKGETTASRVVFFKGTLKAAQEKAAREGKLVFIDFYANWCAPCKNMDDYTFSDPELARYMSDKFVPVKMNIDDFDGFEYKQKYNVNLLPTLLLVDCKGKEIQRKEEGMGSSRLRNFLDQNFQQRYICDKPKVETPAPTLPSTRPTLSRPDKPIVPSPVKPTIPNVSEPAKPTIKPTTRPTPKPTPPKPTVPNVTKPTPPKANNLVGHGLYRFAVQRQPSMGLSVQTGVFGEYANVLREVNKLQRLFPEEPIIVYIAKKPTRTVYKILVGEFLSRAKALKFKNEMKARGVGGFVKDLRYME